ncbi:malto-oligosyltrehalose synthase [Pseudorhodoferax sp. Leaf267]|uniref:malto-oligosyltrehalose synthase n=1 Tax=Pseudorhodoferax sp. Leaf267 TaxID=1736316 RepID=UPI000B2568E2|nr:malto-oligosyltrehalose synthase [Pseudorhodoferax sp. Leaf267]
MTAIIPRATYRLQLHEEFDLAAAQAILPYLRDLGVSHVYCSPITRARPGSRHGYDVADPREVNPELGGREAFDRFAQAARALGLGLLLDIVPNHMGVIGADNPWWFDVLEHGQASAYAGFFDIDWTPFDADLAGKLFLPVLGEPYGEVLEQGQLQVHWEDGGRLVLRYFDHRFPLDGATWGVVLRLAADQAEDADTAEGLTRLAGQADAMPARADLGPARARERAQAAERLRQSFSEQVAARKATAGAVQRAIEQLNADTDRDTLHRLLEAQAYRLGFWRVAADEINYRRFFDINELAALRIEDEQVFEATHALALELTASGVVDGLRIDHPDGLRDPAQYFARLQDGHARRVGQRRPGEAAAHDDALPLYVVAEKITAAHADQPDDWRLHGTTGYRFGALLNGLFVDRTQAERMERVWRGFSGVTEAFDDTVYAAKRAVAMGALGSELTVLTTRLKRIASANRRTRDFGYNTLRDAIAETAACMPVYRTYVVDRASDEDRRFVDWAIAQARQRTAIADTSVFDFLRTNLLGEPAPGSAPDAALPVLRFAWRFQQFCAPVSAKGVEDCSFYRYLRLVSLNEVGGDPATFGVTVAGFHGASADRAARWPHTMLATSTHDNKRSEDVRNRIDVLSELPALWRLGLKRWHQLTRSLQRELPEGPAPSRADESLLYQTLLGSLPTGELDEDQLAEYRERIVQYMTKAARESKSRTSWTRPDAAYEEALTGFVQGVLGRLSPNPVLADLRARAAEMAWFGALNSLAMTVIKYTSPGVPDMYQGNEVIDLSLVDPDNRRPVDYGARARLLAEHQALLAQPVEHDRLAGMARMAADPVDGRLKLWATWRLLALRSEDPALFDDGSYIPLKTTGRARDHLVAYARRTRTGLLIVVVGRLFARLLKQTDRPPVGEACWGDASVDLTAAFKGWEAGGGDMLALDVLSQSQRRLARGPLRVADAFQIMPAAAFWIDGRLPAS